jgi:alcohol dehydrogenase
MEAYISLQKNPLSDAYAMKAIEIITKNLIPVVKDGNNRCRLALANAIHYGGDRFFNAMSRVVHTGSCYRRSMQSTSWCCHEHFPSFWFEFNRSKMGDEIAEMLLPLAGSEVFSSTPVEQRAAKVISVIKDMKNELYDLCKLPDFKRSRGCPRKIIRHCAHALKVGASTYNVEEVEYEDALLLLEKPTNSRVVSRP